MNDHILAWAGFGLALILALPVLATRKLILTVYGLVLRLAFVALLAGAALLWFRPDLLPTEVVGWLDDFPRLRDVLPPPGSQTFGLVAAGLVGVIVLPVLAVLDVARSVVRSRPETEPAAVVAPAPAVAAPAPAVVLPGRQGAADSMAQAGARRPFRVADHVS